MSFWKRDYVPMTRADWAWVLACFICGTSFALLGLVAEISQKNAGHVYAHQVTFETNGDVRKIISAAQTADPESHLVPYSTTPSYNFFSSWFASVLGLIIFSCLFRMLEKICGRFLGLPTRVGIGAGRVPDGKSETRD